ncbi:MAG: variant-type mycofactocin precursor [Deltaproteobacteria bacterium]|nr:variant-type mycofactocin precursor [Deltaproteobacteria bacterium]
MEKEFDKEEGVLPDTSEKEPEDIFKIEEIEIEEMAIDGICGVY